MSDAPATSLKPSRPTWQQALVMLGGGSLLAASACYGTVGAGGNDPLGLTFSALFVAGMGMALVGVIRVIVCSARTPAVTDEISSAPRPTWSQALIMLASGAVLGASSCYGFLETNYTSGMFGAFATGFYVGCLVTLGGLIMMLIRVARSLMRHRA